MIPAFALHSSLSISICHCPIRMQKLCSVSDEQHLACRLHLPCTKSSVDSSTKLCLSDRPGNSGTVLATEVWDLRRDTSWELVERILKVIPGCTDKKGTQRGTELKRKTFKRRLCYSKPLNFIVKLGGQDWRRNDNALLPPIWPRFDSGQMS